MRRLLNVVLALIPLIPVVNSLTSNLTAVTDFKSTSKDVSMYVYIPTKATTTAKPPMVVAIHSCERSAQYYFNYTGYASLADQLGYIVIYPNVSTDSGCWDTSTTPSVTRNGGGDSQAIADMVTYATKNFNGDPDRVSVTGSSSGGIMANLLAGLYPDLFQAASVYSGEYANSIYTAYTGNRPKMMIFHGTTDDVYPYSVLGVELSAWSKVLNVSFDHNVTNTPSGGYTKMVYGDGQKLIGISAAGVGHTVPVDAATDLTWFCISVTCDPDGAVITTTSSSASSSKTTRASSSATSGASTTTGSAAATTTSDGSAATSTTGSVASLTSNAATTTSSAAATSAAAAPADASPGLSTGAKAGISGAVAAFALVGLVAGICLCRRKRRTHADRTSGSEREFKMMPIEAEGHEYHSGYGAVPGAQPVSSRNKFTVDEKHHEAEAEAAVEKMSPLEPTFPAAGIYARDSMQSNRFSPPRSPTYGDPRYSTASSSMFPPNSMGGGGGGGDDNRFSVTSNTMLLPPGSSAGWAHHNRGHSNASSAMGGASVRLVPSHHQHDVHEMYEEEQDIAERRPGTSHSYGYRDGGDEPGRDPRS